ncbi:MAG: DNA (cytosine-5-)-methyltransferase [Planctomycetales bacterium]
METVELFAGIGGFRLAADRLGFVTRWANDLCPIASAVYRARFGDCGLREGDVRALLDEVPPHDLLTAGFPCQPFSSAGKKRGVRDPRGSLFEAIVHVLRALRPRWFVLENVKRLLSMERGDHFATILAALAELDYRIEWRLLNAVDFGLPQNRQRVFLVGTRVDLVGRTGAAAGLVLAGEDESAETRDQRSEVGGQRPSRRKHSRSEFVERGIEWRAIRDHAARFPTWGVAEAGRFVACDLDGSPPASRMAAPRLQDLLEREVDPMFDFTAATQDRLRDNRLVERFVGGVQIVSNQNGGARMGYTIFGIDGVAPTLTATPSRHYERYRIGDRYRRLTNIEYARLQGFPDDHCATASIYDQYALYGNAVPPPVAEWVLGRVTRGSLLAPPVNP